MKMYKHFFLVHRLWLALLIFNFFACSGGSSDNSLPSCGEGALFNVSPIATSAIKAFVPVGRLNPSAHTLPTRHMYYYLNTDSPDVPAELVNVLAPSNMQLTRLTLGTNLSDDSVDPDYSISFNVCGEVEGYFGHVANLPDTLLAAAGDLSSGDCTTYETGGVSYRS
ncbi:MAG: hypothetical protein ACD_73C00208G0001, partial [uncultured bacterium]